MKEGLPKIETPEKKESLEKDANVQIVLKFIRHGERTKEGELTDLGRKITREKAREKREEYEGFHAVKALASNVDPNPETGVGRSLETASIYSKETRGETDKEFIPRPRGLLSYEAVKTKAPYDHRGIYNANLPSDFNELSDDERIKAAKKAQDATITYLFSLNTPQALQFRKEAAGAFAKFIDKYIKMPDKLKSGSRVLIPAGTHGGSMEHLLHQALAWKDKEGKEHIGLEDIDDIGGGFDPSEAYNVFVETDEKGNLKALKVTFDNPNRPQGKMYLDIDKVRELKQFYEKLHKDNDK